MTTTMPLPAATADSSDPARPDMAKRVAVQRSVYPFTAHVV